MLTYTYSLVTLSAEQKKARKTLSTIQQNFRNCAKEGKCVNRSCLDAVFNRLARFDQSHHRRNVELFLIPAVQAVTREADTLLAELDRLSAQCAGILCMVQGLINASFNQDGMEIHELCNHMDLYCTSQLERLTREENELFPIAQRVISNEGWFSLASQFISHVEEEHRNVTQAPQHAAAGHIDSSASHVLQHL